MKFCKEHLRAYPEDHTECSICNIRRLEQEKQQAKAAKPKPVYEIPKQSPKTAKLKREISQTRAEVMKKGHCSGCGRKEGGVIVLEDSHLISKDYCNQYNRPDLYTSVENRRPHCRTWMDHEGCHSKWESNAERHTLLDYRPNMLYIKQALPKVAAVMLMNEQRALEERLKQAS